MDVIKRFWSHIDKSNPDGCWIWKGAANRKGYGYFRYGRLVGVHRLSYELAYGAIPDRLMVLHHCDNPRCVNPDHLWVGTNMDNVRDSMLKGRFNTTPPRSVRTKGQHFGRKLTMPKATAIRNKYDHGQTMTSLANEYSVSIVTIWKIIHYITWT